MTSSETRMLCITKATLLRPGLHSSFHISISMLPLDLICVFGGPSLLKYSLKTVEWIDIFILINQSCTTVPSAHHNLRAWDGSPNYWDSWKRRWSFYLPCKTYKFEPVIVGVTNLPAHLREKGHPRENRMAVRHLS